MGTPKRTKFRQEAGSPTIGDKIRLLEIGKETGKSLDLERLPALLEEVKNLLLPMVSGFDKPLFPEGRTMAMGCPPPKGFQKARAMRLYSERFIAIWLERSGSWLVRLNRSGNDESYQRVDSQQLAKIMLQESGNFLKQSLHWRVDGLAEEIPSVKDIAFYNALIPCVLSKFFENVGVKLKEREDKLYVMKERLSLLNEFAQSLDPLVSQGKTVEIKDYTIFSHYERGASSVTDSYFCPEALEPFWNEIKARRQGSSGYEEHVSKYHFNSLGQFLQRMVWVSEEIQKERERRREPGEAAVNFRTGRLPLTEGELKVIEEAVKSITAKE